MGRVVDEMIDTTPSGRVATGVAMRMKPDELVVPSPGGLAGGVQNAVTLGLNTEGAFGDSAVALDALPLAAISLEAFRGVKLGIRPTDPRGVGLG
ncbi:MAG TPA: hypothetical protein VGP07_14125 [Polyangia bacterium]|jgi:hypothetical protein